jgi:hypothetical protein
VHGHRELIREVTGIPVTLDSLHPRRFGDLVHRDAEWIGRYFDALAMADVDVVMVHDEMVWGNGPF